MSNQQPPGDLPWMLSQWHAISGATSPIKMDGVLFQDLMSILRTMFNYQEVIDWPIRLQEMYEHLSEYNNPHSTTIEQFPVDVLTYLYHVWRTEGYDGTKQEFTDIIFNYIQVVQYSELYDNTSAADPDVPVLESELCIPTVHAVAGYIRDHNEAIEDVHDPLLGRIFSGADISTVPCTALSRYHLAYEDHINIMSFDVFPTALGVPLEYCIMITGNYYNFNGCLFKLYSKDTSTKEAFTLNYIKEGNSIELVRTDRDGNDTVLMIVNVPNQKVPEKFENRICCFMSVHGGRVSLTVREGTTHALIDNTVVEIGDIAFTSSRRGPLLAGMAIPSYSFPFYNDGVEQVVVYPERVTEEFAVNHLLTIGEFKLSKWSHLYDVTDQERIMLEQLNLPTSPVYTPVHIGNKFVNQSDTLRFTFQELVNNPLLETPAKSVTFTRCTGGIIEKIGLDYLYHSQSICQTDQWIQFTLHDDSGKVLLYSTYVIDVGPLSDITLRMYSSAEIDGVLDVYKPPTFAEVFSTWSRTDDSSYYESGEEITEGDAGSWVLTGGTVVSGSDSSNAILLISSEEFENYTHTCTLQYVSPTEEDTSEDTNDGRMYVVVAFKRVDDINHALVLHRDVSDASSPVPGLSGFALSYVKNSLSTILAYDQTNKVGAQEVDGKKTWLENSLTMVQVTRNGTKVTVKSSPFGSISLDEGSELSIDASGYPMLDWLEGPLPYGYGSHSQKNVGFLRASVESLENIDDLIVNYDTGEVYVYLYGSWRKKPQLIWDLFEYPRNVNIKDSDVVYRLDKGSLTLVGE